MKDMKIILLSLFATFFFVAACARATPPQAATAKPSGQTPAAEVLQEGKALYNKYCAACHGAQGEGTSLAPKIAGHSQGAMKMQVRSPMGKMPAFPASQINDKDLENIVSFVYSLSPATMSAMEWEKEAPETMHHWMALLAIKNNDAADARHHLDQALTFVKELKHKSGMERAMTMMSQGKLHDMEHEIEEMAGGEAPSGMTIQRFHLQLVKRAVEAKDLAQVKHHVEKFMVKATDREKKIANELLKKVEKGDFHEAEHEVEELIKG